jgi:hypothetical protein
MGPHSVASYDMQCVAEDLLLPGPSRDDSKESQTVNYMGFQNVLYVQCVFWSHQNSYLKKPN